MDPNLCYKFEMICLMGIKVIEQKQWGHEKNPEISKLNFILKDFQFRLKETHKLDLIILKITENILRDLWNEQLPWLSYGTFEVFL